MSFGQQIVVVGCSDPEHAADAVLATVMGTLRRHLAAVTQPSSGEVEYLVSFCLKAIDPQVPASTVARSRRARPVRKSRMTNPG